ncbi:Vps51/Vps67-domain-containing protein [Apodospora peruviana]|uniref:Vacuolar protein sorting-associated protein 51 homolog n=1 Tax=Apodospora peruviana TaxID=516989 RepID=A0AAE0M896_9PEZI|nr:Vps51/Vps67-domain-containing protein [Apodospora peruviana]
MSTIASPRDSGTPLVRRMNSSQAIITPTSSTRPSLDLPRSASGSPNLNASSSAAFTDNNQPLNDTRKRGNRAALRAYYNLKKAAAAAGGAPGTPTLEITTDENPLDLPASHNESYSTIPHNPELDAPSFDADAFVAKTLDTSSLSELLRTYTRMLCEIRALDAEKKALVYDNYSKLISATESIRKMRSTMDPLNPMAGTLDVVVGKIYEQASGIREELRRTVPPPPPVPTTVMMSESKEEEQEGERRRARTRALAVEVAAVPDTLRRLMQEGKEEEARRQWEMPRRLLERWKERGFGGDDVHVWIEEGDSILEGGR